MSLSRFMALMVAWSFTGVAVGQSTPEAVLTVVTCRAR